MKDAIYEACLSSVVNRIEQCARGRWFSDVERDSHFSAMSTVVDPVDRPSGMAVESIAVAIGAREWLVVY